MERIRESRRRSGRAWNMHVEEFALSDEKKGRISRLEPDLHNGWIELDAALPPEVIEEFRDHPSSAFDDGMDAIERADWLLTAGGDGVAFHAGIPTLRG